jgi:hypothetical protein
MMDKVRNPLSESVCLFCYDAISSADVINIEWCKVTMAGEGRDLEESDHGLVKGIRLDGQRKRAKTLRQDTWYLADFGTECISTTRTCQLNRKYVIFFTYQQYLPS